MPRPLLTVFAAPGARPTGGFGVQRLELPDGSAAMLDRALAAALAPVALRLGPGEALLPEAACAAARAAHRQAHRSWWWACPAGPAHRSDLLTLLLGHADPLPTTLFRPEAVHARGGFGRHAGPAFAYADACARLAESLLPGRVEGPVVTPGPAGEQPAELRLDRAEVAADFADRCPPRGRDAVWAACARTRAGALGPRPARRPAPPLRAAA